MSLRVLFDTNVALDVLLAVSAVTPVGRDELVRAADSAFSDVEDGVLQEAARSAGADLIATRNDCDFGAATLPVLRPGGALARIG